LISLFDTNSQALLGKQPFLAQNRPFIVLAAFKFDRIHAYNSFFNALHFETFGQEIRISTCKKAYQQNLEFFHSKIKTYFTLIFKITSVNKITNYESPSIYLLANILCCFSERPGE